MALPTRPPTTLTGIKSCAKKLKRLNSITHREALEEIARWAGFDSYDHARRSMEP